MNCVVEVGRVRRDMCFLCGLDVRYIELARCNILYLFYRSCEKTSEEEDYVLLSLTTLATLTSRSLLIQVSVLSLPAEDGLRLYYGK